jgi:hypothetical protein
MQELTQNLEKLGRKHGLQFIPETGIWQSDKFYIDGYVSQGKAKYRLVERVSEDYNKRRLFDSVNEIDKALGTVEVKTVGWNRRYAN